tara:strand:- start:9782 stop:11248 length:1467 start_codon:yes stop_codon:yes gene_type:complete
MSEYNEAANKAEVQLKEISSSMCYAKWAQVSMHLTNGMTHSCYHPPTHKIDIAELEANPSALHNTKQKKEERKQMLAGEKPEGCSYCWKIEDKGGRSDRIYKSGEYWAQNARKDIIAASSDGNISPRYVEVNFNQACNLKCMYCSPHLSTAWEDEIKKHGAYKLKNTTHNDIGYLEQTGLMPIKVAQKDNPYVSAFWRWFPDLYKTLEVFRMTGGEPLMDSNTFKVMDYIYENPNASLEVSVTSNMSPPKQILMDKFIAKLQKLEEIRIWEDKEKFNPGSGNHWYVQPAIKNFALFVSVDSIGDQAEYIRTGLDFELMDTNIHKILDETDSTTITFINTFNALSVPRLKEYLQYVNAFRSKVSADNQGIKYKEIYDKWNTHAPFELHPRQRIHFDIPLLRYPTWQSVQVLPEEYNKYVEDAIEYMEANPMNENFVGFYDFEIDKVKRNLQFMKEHDNLELENFKLHFQQHDERRNTNFKEVFPEYSEL